MGREDGICDFFVLNGDRSLGERAALGRSFVGLLAEVHSLDWRALGLARLLPGAEGRGSLQALEHWEATMRRVQPDPQPELELVIAWLRRHAPVCRDVVLVHGDWKPGNALLLDSPGGWRIGTMLDWETAHLGDPIEDVGWITNPLRAREHQIPGAWTRAEIVAHYEQVTGRVVDPFALHWWNILAIYKLAVIVLTGVRAYIDGRLERPYTTPLNLYRLMEDLVDKAPT